MAVSFNPQSGPPQREMWNTNLHTLVPDCWRTLEKFLTPFDQYMLSLTASSLRGRFSHVKKTGICSYASKNSYRSIIEWLHTHFKWPFTASMTTGAVEGNQIEMIEWLHQHSEMDSRSRIACFKVTLCEKASREGQLEMLKKLRSIQCPWDEQTWNAAVEEGRLKVLKWLHENNCPKYDRKTNGPTCTAAAHRGHLHVLQWARDRNFPWSELTYTLAQRGGHLTVIEWLRRHRCPGS